MSKTNSSRPLHLGFLLLALICVSCSQVENTDSADSSTNPSGDITRNPELPGEMSAEAILDGKYLWPDSPAVDTSTVDSPDFKADAFGQAPAPGVHPRILLSPEDLPALRQKTTNTKSGKFFYHQITYNQEKSIRRKGTYSYELTKALAAGDRKKAEDIISGKTKLKQGQRYSHRNGYAYVLMTEAFDSLIRDDEKMGKEVAAAITTLSEIYHDRLVTMDDSFKAGQILDQYSSPDRYHGFRMDEGKIQLNSDVWRSGRRAAIDGEPWLAFMYDYAHPWMSEAQRSTVRKTLNLYHAGKTTMGSHMPHHFRNWNWIAIGSGGLYLTALATEGEEGNDPRVIQHTREILTDFIKYGWSDMGSSNEAIGYTQFGLRWGVPGLIAMARRGDNLWDWKRWRNSVDWYAHAAQPDSLNQPGDRSLRFISHGDGGQGGPALFTMGAFKQFYPQDPTVDFVLQRVFQPPQQMDGQYPEPGRGFYNSYPHMELIMANDSSDKDYRDGEKLDLPLTFFDPERNALITRSDWGPNRLQLQMEARNDSTSADHQHADSGAFTLSGAGRVWADERFRSIESRHHSMVTIDGKGQGYFTPPADWLGLVDNDNVTIGAVDASYAYAWAWPGQLLDPEDPRLLFKRWEGFKKKHDAFYARNPNFNWKEHVDPHPTVEKFYKGFEAGDPRIWDEYPRPVRIEHNPVEKAFRSATVVRGKFPYAVITDDIKKDDQERLYEWIMMLTPDTDLFSITTDEILLYETDHPGVEGNDLNDPNRVSFYGLTPKLAEGVPMCLVQVIERSIPEDVFTNPQIRLESFELKDARDWPDGRGFKLQKRLVIPSRAVDPKFKVLLYPHTKGQPMPEISWNEKRDQVTVSFPDQVDTITFTPDSSGRTKVKVTRDGNVLGEL
jgi:hypothetical protein